MVKLTRLREVRERKAFSQRELAEKAGVTRPTITRIENGREQPYGATTRKIAAALGVEPHELMEPT